MTGSMMEGWGGMWGFGWIFMILFWALLIVGVAALVRWVFPTGKSACNEDARQDVESRTNGGSA